MIRSQNHTESSLFLYLAVGHWSFPDGSDGEESACNAGDQGSIPGREDLLEEDMATHSSILAWRIPWAEEPGGLQSTGLQRNQTQLSD